MKTVTRSRKSYALSVAVSVSVAAWLTGRWVVLGTEVASLQRQLADNLRAVPGATTDPGTRVALIVQADEPLLDRAIALASARVTLLWITCVVWLLALGLAWAWRRAHNAPPSGTEASGSVSSSDLSDQL